MSEPRKLHTSHTLTIRFEYSTQAGATRLSLEEIKLGGQRGMIEALVQYIENKGFTVNVRPGILTISKHVEGVGYASQGWAISQVVLAQAHKEVLFAEADRYMDLIDQQFR